MKATLLFAGFLLCISATEILAQNMLPDSLFGAYSKIQVSPGETDMGYDLLYQTADRIIYGGFDYAQDGYYIDMVGFNNCGDIDSSFGTNGIEHTKFDYRSVGYCFNKQEDNKILCGGQQASSNAGSAQIPCISRFNEDGSVDLSFNGTGFNSLRYDDYSSGSINSICVMPDSRILCIGTCVANANGGVDGIGLIRFNPDGTPDSTFSGDGKAVYSGIVFTYNGEAHGHLLESGRIIAVGSIWDVNFLDYFFAMAFDSTGAIDTTFGNGGFFSDNVPLLVYGNVLESALQPDDKVLMMANCSSGNGIEVIRLTQDGIIDSAFATYGHLNINISGMTAKRIKVLSDGKIMVTGSYSLGNGVGCGVMLNNDGSVDTGFGSGGFMIFDLNDNYGSHSVNDLLEVSPDHWLVGGYFNDFLVRKYTNLSNVPHISISGSQLVSSGTGTFQWYLEGIQIAGENGNTFTPNQNGSYSVEITDNSGCTYMSDPFEVNSVGINEQDLNLIKIYPNPFSDELQVILTKDEPAEIVLYDVSSRIVMQRQFRASVSLDTREMPKGLYFYEIRNENRVISKGKLVRNN